MKNNIVDNGRSNFSHEICIYHLSANSLRDVIKLLAHVSSSGTEHRHFLIDASTAGLLPLRLLVKGLRQIAFQEGQVRASIALVIPNQAFMDEMHAMIKTILERDSVELFTDVSKAKLWLELENKRYMKRQQ